jgi:glycolate dehydrogenase FAD-binding subunit
MEPASVQRIAPASVAGAEAILGSAAGSGAAVAFVGGETEFGLGYPLERADVFLDTKGLDRIVEYAPEDLVVEVEAGMTLAALQAALRENRQRLALDPPLPARATIGGLIATNAFGPRRTRFGTLRDLIVGISLVRADGVRVRGGGKVVKNVAGFDLPKIAVGSLGTLGMIATATFRLHPLPEAVRMLSVRTGRSGMVRTLARELIARRMEPSAVAAYDDSGGYELYVVFEGFEAGVAEQAGRFAALASQFDLRCEQGAFADRDAAARTYGDLRFRISAPPSALDAVEDDVLGPLREALGHFAVAIYPTVGIVFAGHIVDDLERTAAAVLAARASVEQLGGNLVVTEAPSGWSVDVYGTLPASFGLMRELKARFDPERRLNRGRFVGRL